MDVGGERSHHGGKDTVKVFSDSLSEAVTGGDNGPARVIWFMDLAKKINGKGANCAGDVVGSGGGG